jgi:putative spermidine/putrescine transport system permease protein
MLQAYSGLLLLVMLAPFLVIAVGSVLNSSFLGVSTEQWSGASEGFFSFHWFGYVWGLYGEALLFSVKLACLSVVLCLVIGVPAGFALSCRRFAGSRVLETLVLLPVSLPGIAMSLALIQTYAVVRGAWWLILCGHLLYTLPFMVRQIMSLLSVMDMPVLEASSRSMGASFLQFFALVVLPNLRHAMLSGSLMVFSISFGEFNVSYMLNTPTHQTYPAALYATYTSNSFQVAGAATVIFLAVLLPLLMVIQWLGGRAGNNVEQGA